MPTYNLTAAQFAANLDSFDEEQSDRILGYLSQREVFANDTGFVDANGQADTSRITTQTHDGSEEYNGTPEAVVIKSGTADVNLFAGNVEALVFDSESGGSYNVVNETFSEVGIFTGNGDDTIFASTGTGDGVFVVTNDGDDVVYSTHVADTVYAGEGNDTVYSGSGDDLVYGGDGDDSLYGQNGSDTIYGGDGNDFINGGIGADSLYGGSGSDTILGGDGANDQMFGDGGNDVFRFTTAAFGDDTVDGGNGAGDTVDFGQRDLDGTVTITNLGGTERLIEFGDGSSVTVKDVEILKFKNGDLAI